MIRVKLYSISMRDEDPKEVRVQVSLYLKAQGYTGKEKDLFLTLDYEEIKAFIERWKNSFISGLKENVIIHDTSLKEI